MLKGKEPRHGAGLEASQVPVPVPPDGLQGGLSPRKEVCPRTRLSLPPTEVSVSRPVRFQRVTR